MPAMLTVPFVDRTRHPARHAHGNHIGGNVTRDNRPGDDQGNIPECI